jgi:hypothetical protein
MCCFKHQGCVAGVLQVGCAEFTLLVLLLCSGAAHQHLQVVHAYAGSITRLFLGKAVLVPG